MWEYFQTKLFFPPQSCALPPTFLFFSFFPIIIFKKYFPLIVFTKSRSSSKFFHLIMDILSTEFLLLQQALLCFNLHELHDFHSSYINVNKISNIQEYFLRQLFHDHKFNAISANIFSSHGKISFFVSLFLTQTCQGKLENLWMRTLILNILLGLKLINAVQMNRIVGFLCEFQGEMLKHILTKPFILDLLFFVFI